MNNEPYLLLAFLAGCIFTCTAELIMLKILGWFLEEYPELLKKLIELEKKNAQNP